MCLPVYTHMFLCRYMCVETGGQCWLSFPIATHLVCGEKASLDRDLMDSASYVSQQSRSSCPHLPRSGVVDKLCRTQLFT